MKKIFCMNTRPSKSPSRFAKIVLLASCLIIYQGQATGEFQDKTTAASVAEYIRVSKKLKNRTFSEKASSIFQAHRDLIARRIASKEKFTSCNQVYEVLPDVATTELLLVQNKNRQRSLTLCLGTGELASIATSTSLL